jgi:hypothetical protein
MNLSDLSVKSIKINEFNGYNLYKVYIIKNHKFYFYLSYEFNNNNITLYETFKNLLSTLNIKFKNKIIEIETNENNNNITNKLFIDYKYNFINNFKFNFNLIIAINESIKNFYIKTGKYCLINLNYVKIRFIYSFIYDINYKSDDFIIISDFSKFIDNIFNLIYFIFNRDLYSKNKNNNNNLNNNEKLNDLLTKLLNNQIKSLDEYLNHDFFKIDFSKKNYDQIKLYLKKFFSDDNLYKTFDLYPISEENKEKTKNIEINFENEKIFYKGEGINENENFIANGRGLLNFKLNIERNYNYLGEINFGKLNGKGKLIISDKKFVKNKNNDNFYIIEGEFKNNELINGTLFFSDNKKIDNVEEIKKIEKIKFFFTEINKMFFSSKDKNYSFKKIIKINEIDYFFKFFTNEEFFLNLFNILFFDIFFDKNFIEIENYEEIKNHRKFFCNLDDFYENYFNNHNNYLHLIDEKVINKEYIDDIILLFIILIYSLFIKATPEFNFNLYCFDDFQKIKLNSIQQNLISLVIDLKFVNFEFSQFLLDIDEDIDYDKYNLYIIIKIIRKLYKNIINNFIKEKEEKKKEKLMKEIKKKSDKEVLGYLFILSWCYYCFKEDRNYKINKTINISCAHFTEFNSALLLFVFRLFNDIKIINLQYNELAEFGSYSLATLFHFSKNIEIVLFNKNNLVSKDLFYFIEGIKKTELKNLKKIDLTGNSLDEISGKYLSQLIKLSPNLEEINLNNNLNFKNGIKYIVITILKLQKTNKKHSLKHLIIPMINLEQNGINLLSKLTVSKKCSIETLCLNYNNLNNPAGKNFIKNLKYNKSIKELYLCNCDINNSFVSNIKNIIIGCELNSFSLFQNNIFIFEKILKIYYLFKINWKLKQEKHYFPITINFDASNNKKFFIDKKDIKLLNSIIEKLRDFILLDVYDLLSEYKKKKEIISLFNLIANIKEREDKKKQKDDKNEEEDNDK